MPLDAITAVVDAIAADGIQLPGVSGEAGTAAAFAGHWAERTRSPARPVEGQRILEANDGVRVRLEVRHHAGWSSSQPFIAIATRLGPSSR